MMAVFDANACFKRLEEEAYEVMQAYEKVQAIASEKKAALESVLKETEGLRKIQSDAKCAEVDISAKLEACERSSQESAKKVKHWERELKHLRKAEKQAEDLDISDDDDDEKEKIDGREEKDDDEGPLDVEMEDMSEAIARPTGESLQKEPSLPTYNVSALTQYDRDEVKEDIHTLEKERDTMAKNANMAAIAEYRRKEEDYLKR